jgi:hypothetical protein
MEKAHNAVYCSNALLLARGRRARLISIQFVYARGGICAIIMVINIMEALHGN